MKRANHELTLARETLRNITARGDHIIHPVSLNATCWESVCPDGCHTSGCGGGGGATSWGGPSGCMDCLTK